MADTPVILDENSNLSAQDVAQLLQGAGGPPGAPAPPQEQPSDLEVALAGGLEEVVIPATIERTDGRKFFASDLRSWGWTPFGIYAVGHYEDEPEDTDRHLLIAGREVATVELHAETYEAFVAKVKADRAEAEEPGEEPEAEQDAESDASSD